ncbi:hypothetical protein HDV03_000221 [Kappamyces sp. JEL0829]|nr:hypothetical protein HDV03_000221 [Kappamyces sp. JEL0829]
MDGTAVGTSAAIGLAAGLACYLATRKDVFKDIPGPQGVPFFGNVFQIKSLETLHETLEEWAFQYGPLYKFSIMGNTMLVVSDWEAIQEILKKRPDGFSRDAQMRAAFVSFKTDGLFSFEGATWSKSRPPVAAALTPVKVRGMQRVVVEEALALQKELNAYAERQAAVIRDFAGPISPPHPRNRFDPKQLEPILTIIQKKVLQVLLRTALVSDVPIPENLVAKADRYFAQLGARSFASIPYWKFYRSADDKDAEDFVSSISNFIDALLKEASTRSRDYKPKSAMTMLENLVWSEEEQKLTKEELKGNLYHVLAAGYETTSTTFYWLLYFLAKYPHVQDKLHSEADAVLPGLDFDSVTDVTKTFVYTTCLVKEVLRYMPVVPGLSFDANHDTELLGHWIPKGTQILTLGRIVSFEKTPTPDPYHFNPDRWDPRLVPEDVLLKQTQYSLQGFGGGPRVCPGKHLAMSELVWFTALCAASFTVEDYPRPAGHNIVTGVTTFTYTPQNLHVKLTPRG